MIRRASFDDAPAIMALLRDFLPRSKYAGRARIAEPALQHLVSAILAQQANIGPHGTCVFVAEQEGKVVGFIAGILDRVYMIGSKLTAQDLFLINDGGSVSDTLRLVDAYLAWARSIRAVLEIRLSWVDTLPGAERMANVYARKGLTKCGEIFEVATDARQEEAA